MKWLCSVIVLVLLVAILLIAGCGNETTSSPVDTTPPTTPSNLIKATPDNSRIPTFTWDAATDDDSGVARYLVRISEAGSQYGGSWTDVGDVSTYTRPIGLADGDYTFEVKAVDQAGNEGTAASLSFTCHARPPIISETHVSEYPLYSCTNIYWETDEPSTSQLEYGETADYGYSTLLDENLVTSHRLALRNLEENTSYHFRVRSKDSFSNEAISEDQTFTAIGNPDRVYTSLTGGSEVISMVKELRISPGIAVNGESQTYSVWVQCGEGHNVATVTTVTIVGTFNGVDDVITSFPMQLVEGTTQLGRWEGGWKVEAPKDRLVGSTFWFRLIAETDTGYSLRAELYSDIVFP
jgi:hypothetical protein